MAKRGTAGRGRAPASTDCIGREEPSRPPAIVGPVPGPTALRSLATQVRLRHGFSTAAMGSMGLINAPDPAPVLESRRRFAAELGVDPASITVVGAVHGTEVARVDAPRSLFADVDGLVTDRAGIALFATYADCYPLVAYDPHHHAVGLVHAGWRGTASGIAQRLVSVLMENFDTDPEALLVGIGPGICGACYEVGPEFADHFPDAVLTRAVGARMLLDLAEANRLQFLAAGVGADHIEVDGSCTLETADLFSHRRQPDGTRFAALVALR